MGAGFRSANRSVAGTGSAGLWCADHGRQVRQPWHGPEETLISCLPGWFFVRCGLLRLALCGVPLSASRSLRTRSRWSVVRPHCAAPCGRGSGAAGTSPAAAAPCPCPMTWHFTTGCRLWHSMGAVDQHCVARALASAAAVAIVQVLLAEAGGTSRTDDRPPRLSRVRVHRQLRCS